MAIDGTSVKFNNTMKFMKPVDTKTPLKMRYPSVALVVLFLCTCGFVYGLMWIRACFYIQEQPMREWTREDCTNSTHREKGKLLVIAISNPTSADACREVTGCGAGCQQVSRCSTIDGS